jgi:dolichol-phosphate mannosyltransferase
VAPSLSIVVPCFNERDNVPVVVEALVDWGRGAIIRGAVSSFEIVVVDDGSRDGSAEVIPRAPEVRVVSHAQNRGLTAALRTGFSNARLELVTWLPADGQIGADAVDALLAARGDASLVISTYDHRPDGAWRTIMSRTSRVLVWALIGFRGRLEGIYLFERALLDRIALVSTRSAGIVAFELAAKVHRLGLPIATTQIACHPRMSGRSKVADARNVMAFVSELVRIRASMR